jgi:hypothetical protein
VYWCFRGFNFREKLEEKNESSEKYFGSLGKWCKTKKLGDKKCKKHRSIGENFKIPGGAPTPPYFANNGTPVCDSERIY